MTKPTREKWKALAGNESYFISNHGQIRGPFGGILKPFTCRSGHLQVVICKDGEKKSQNVHVLVLTTFVGPAPEGLECLHRDGNAANNKVWNLRWGTRAENIEDMRRHSDRMPNSLITISEARTIRSCYDGKANIKAYARSLELPYLVVFNIITGKTYKDAI